MRPGQIVLFRFPQADLAGGKLRPALLPGKLPVNYDDLLLCMISTQIRHYTERFDELVDQHSEDFQLSGLKAASVIRVGRLAVAERDIHVGAIGSISRERLSRILANLASWLESLKNS